MRFINNKGTRLGTRLNNGLPLKLRVYTSAKSVYFTSPFVGEYYTGIWCETHVTFKIEIGPPVVGLNSYKKST